MRRFLPQTILITGASSGLGAALALEYAAPNITLFLLARDATRLEDVSQACRVRGATVVSALIDVCDADAVRAWILAQDATAPIELVIANAGISGGTSGVGESEAQVRAIFDVNVTGVLNTILPLEQKMRERRRGQIAIMSSLASIRPLPSAPAYSASKAAIRFYGEALAGVVKKSSVMVSVICPGYIHTPLTQANDFPMPAIMDAECAAARIKHALSCGKRRIAFPKRLYFPLYMLSIFSPNMTNWFFDVLPAKEHKI